MSIGGVIGQALLGAVGGAGTAAAQIGKSQYDNEMADKQAAADFQRKKDLLALQDEMAGARHEKTVKFDQGFKEDTGKAQGIEVDNAYQQAIKDYKLKQIQDANEDPTITHDTAAPEEYADVSGPSATDALGMRAAIQQKLGYHDQAKDTLAQQHLGISQQQADTAADRQDTLDQRVSDQFDIGMAHSQATLASANSREASQASREQLASTSAAAKAANLTVSQLLAEKKDFQKTAVEQAMLGGKSPEALKQQEENKQKLASYDKQIASTRSYAMGLQKSLAANGYDSEAAPEAASPATVTTFLKTGATQQDKPAAAAPTTPTAPSKPDVPSPRVISDAIGAKPADANASLADKRANAPPAMQALQAQLMEESTKLKQLDTEQSGAVPKSQLSANIAKKKAQLQIVDDLKVKLNAASEAYGMYPWGRF